MNTQLNYTVADVRSAVDGAVYARGRDYVDSGMVHQLIVRGDTLYAAVEGSQYEPYQVRIDLADGAIGDADCTCPYDWGGWCKHIVAVLLAALEEPQTIEARSDVEQLIASLDRAQLHALLLELVDEQPALADAIEGWVARQTLASTVAAVRIKTDTTSTPIATTAPASLDLKMIRTQVRQALRGMSQVEAAEQLLTQVQAMLAAGDSRNALTMLTALTDEYMARLPDAYDEYDDYRDEYDGEGDSYEIFKAFDLVWAEAILSVALSNKEQDELAAQLDEWEEDAVEKGYDDAFTIAPLALEYGWDYPPLQRVMQGSMTEAGAWEGEAPFGAEELAVVRLNVLERQERREEYLNLAQAEGQFRHYVVMLAKLGRVEQTVRAAIQFMTETDDLLPVAVVLHQQGATEAAIQVARHGLQRAQREKHGLAVWLRDLYVAQGDYASAIPPAITALTEQPSLADYQRLAQWAGDGWSSVRSQVLSALRTGNNFYTNQARVDIFLSEELWDDAINVVNSDYGSRTVITVMEQVYQHRPDWVIRKASPLAEAIINAGKAQRYDEAVTWLDHARKAYLAAGRGDEWRSYVGKIRTAHGRKYKLMGLLKRF